MNLVYISDRLPARHPALVHGFGRILAEHGMGRQIPPDLLMVGGALLGRVAVTRIDAARDHLTDECASGKRHSRPGQV